MNGLLPLLTYYYVNSINLFSTESGSSLQKISAPAMSPAKFCGSGGSGSATLHVRTVNK
jgi:hypothetical protein